MRIHRLMVWMVVFWGMCGIALAGKDRLDVSTLKVPIYTPEGDGFVRHNGERFNNRPLYCNQIPAIVIAGDRPLLRFGYGTVLNGTFIIALQRGERAVWLQDCSDITSIYRPDRMQWIIRDARLGETVLRLDAVPPAEGAGMAVRLRIENGQAEDKLIWAGGGATQKNSVLNDWDVTTAGRDAIMKITFSPQDCAGNRVVTDGDRFIIQHSSARPASTAIGRCSLASKITIADARQWKDPLQLAASSGTQTPVACGTLALAGKTEVYFGMMAFRGGKVGDTRQLESPEEIFAAGMRRAEEIGRRIVVDTPDAQFNAAVAASSAVTDGVFREGIFTHSGMRWGIPLLGWRTLFGGTVYGWHDRVMAQARTCIAKQIVESDKTAPKADEKYGLASQSSDSRLFGKGRVDTIHPRHYDMQTQFFDQLIHAWRWTGDPELEKLLRPALELHLEYIHDCFDPDDDGLYESYANSWPTDDQWYNGGGTAEETAYAYTGHRAALEMARRAGDAAAVKRHESRLARIHQAFMDKLWIPSKGYVGGWVEQGGHGRLHEDSWLYAIFCPIDAGMLTREQSASSLYYTEWAMEREQMPYGGQRCWTSNWVPSIWSLREMWPGDNYHLALAYMQTGLADEGWSILRGTFVQSTCYGPVPGDFGYSVGGTDFNDCSSMFCRVVVEGMFGFRPDYPNGIVTIAPQLPSQWDHASIKTPEFALQFEKNCYHIEIPRAAAMDLRLPVRAGKVNEVRVNGQPVKWELLPGYGCSVVKIELTNCKSAMVQLSLERPLPQAEPVSIEAPVGKNIALPMKDAKIVGSVAVPETTGFHWVEALTQADEAPQYRIFKIHRTDPKTEAELAARALDKAPADATWECVDLSKDFNADIRTIFQQKYLSPRPNTVSLRLATDGYSTWQMVLDPKHKAPSVDLSAAAELLDGSKRLRTPPGVPFAWAGQERNIALTSMWDNWPRQISVPVKRKAEGIYFMVCGFTNPMQCRISNAELRLTYADGVVEKIELIPPINFWSMCRFGDADYDYKRDGFCLPGNPPTMVQLGENCRAIVLGRKLRPDVELESVTLETLSQEVMIGMMGVSLMNPR